MARRPVLVDSSIWIEHFKSGHPALASLLKARRVVTHPFVIGEVAMGSLRDRTSLLHELGKLPALLPAGNAEVMAMVEWDKLYSQGIGFIDAHLLAATRLVVQATLLTRDNKLNKQAQRLGVAYKPA